MEQALVVWLLIAGVALVGLAITSVRVVPEHERAAVLRLGHLVGVRGPGLVFVAPGIERLHRVSLRPVRLDSVVVHAVTRDGMSVRMLATASCRVSEPVVSALAVSDPWTATVDAVESALRKEIEHTDLAGLAVGRVPLAQHVLLDLNLRASGWGVTVLDVVVDDVEMQLGTDLLRWARWWATEGRT